MNLKNGENEAAHQTLEALQRQSGHTGQGGLKPERDGWRLIRGMHFGQEAKQRRQTGHGQSGKRGNHESNRHAFAQPA